MGVANVISTRYKTPMREMREFPESALADLAKRLGGGDLREGIREAAYALKTTEEWVKQCLQRGFIHKGSHATHLVMMAEPDPQKQFALLRAIVEPRGLSETGGPQGKPHGTRHSKGRAFQK